MLQAIDHAGSGDLIKLNQNGNRRLVVDQRGTPIWYLAKGLDLPTNIVFNIDRVNMVTRHFRPDSADKLRASVRQDRWKVVLPAFVYRT